MDKRKESIKEQRAIMEKGKGKGGQGPHRGGGKQGKKSFRNVQVSPQRLHIAYAGR
jgi:hypothetical protein